MERSLPCEKHEEQIKTLFKQDEVINKRIDGMDNMKDFMYSLDKNMALQTQLLESVNTKMDEQHEINVKVNDNLTKLAEQYNTLNNKVDTIGNEQEKLTKKVEENEEKHKIDWRDIIKNFVIKVGIPTGILYGIVELVKAKL